jgi:hypothetical protein
MVICGLIRYWPRMCKSLLPDTGEDKKPEK